MRFRNSIALLVENFRCVYKILLYQLIVAIIAIALTSALLLPNLFEITDSAEMSVVVGYGKDFLKALLGGDSAYLAAFQEPFQEAVKDLLALAQVKMPKIIWSLVGCALVYIVKRLADTLCYFSVGNMLHDRMSRYAETPFSASYIRNMGRALVYSLVYVPIVFFVDVITIALCYFLFFYLMSFLNLFIALFLSVTLIVVCQATKLTLTSLWLPAMVADNYSIGGAMRAFSRTRSGQREKVYSTYIVSVYLVIVVNVVAAIFTIGSALLITVPASYFLFICEQFVFYYTANGKKYFITFDRIVENRDYGDSAHFFDYSAQAEVGKTENAENADNADKAKSADGGEYIGAEGAYTVGTVSAEEKAPDVDTVGRQQ